MTTTANPTPARWAVINCPVTILLDLVDTEAEATQLAEEWGGLAFPHQLSEAEAIAAAGTELPARIIA